MRFIEDTHSRNRTLYIAPTNEWGHGAFISSDGLTSRLITKNDLFLSYTCDVEAKLWEAKYDKY